MEFISFQSSMKCQKFSGATLREKLSEDELSCKVLGTAVYTKIYCRVQRNRVLFIPVQWENSGHTDHKANEGGWVVPHGVSACC